MGSTYAKWLGRRGGLTELSVDLADAHGLEATDESQRHTPSVELEDGPIQDAVKLLATSRDSDALLANVAKFGSSDEATGGRLQKINHNKPAARR